MVVGANLPDVDVLAYLWGPAADLAFRRGWTHGILALAVWPFLLTGAMLLYERGRRRLGRPAQAMAVDPRRLLLLAAVAILSHPLLDTLNTYGMRWLMPLSGRWFYGDTLFIIDPWIWLALGTGVALSRPSRATTRPARLALALALIYTTGMAASALLARHLARRELAALTGEPVRRLMVSPVPVDPLVRSVVAAQGDRYRMAEFRWLARPHLNPASLRTFPAGGSVHPAAGVASATLEGRRFLGWARFPVFQVEPGEGLGAYVVHILDLRFADHPDARFGAISIPVTIPPGSAPFAGSPPPSSSAAPAAPAP